MGLNPELVGWNTRGLNDQAKQDTVREFLTSVRASIVCLQETKMAVIGQFLLIQCLGPVFDGFLFLPADGTRGGILLA